ncbi:LysR family transcriptional regulator [Litoribacillus peritrichatus]|uniref:LysR family transcriptional regulator n=1 Tax=Litoribacillus peritrichatus TaxID=718191 RepID=A0ABP7MGX5_9GAMM
MNWDDLRFFLALAREGTVSGAGRVLSVKHTTVARRISALEGMLGSRLFDRMPSGYALTQVGENLMPHAVGMEELMNAADREVFGMDAQLRGSLKLAASYDVLNRLITPKLPLFVNKYPEIDLELISSTDLIDLNSRQADIAVRLSPKPPEYLIGKEVLPLKHGIYASESYLKQGQRKNTVVLWRHEKEVPEWLQDHFPDSAVALRVSEIMTMVEAVKNGLGVARMPCYVADAEPGLRRLDLPLTPSNWGVWVLSHADLRSTARVRACRDFLIDVIEQQRDLILGNNSVYS